MNTKNTFKTITVVTALTVAAFGFTGCADTSAPEPAPTSPAVVETETPTPTPTEDVVKPGETIKFENGVTTTTVEGHAVECPAEAIAVEIVAVSAEKVDYDCIVIDGLNGEEDEAMDGFTG